MMLAPFVATVQDAPDLQTVPISGLPAGARVLAYGIARTEPGRLLVTEIESPDGTVSFYLFDYIDHELVGRMIGPRSIPGDLAAPPTQRPARGVASRSAARYWPVGATGSADSHDQLIGAPSLDALRFIEIGPSPWQLSPPPQSPLAIRRLRVSVTGSILDECIIEPNLVAADDRMTTTGAWRVDPYGKPHLLVGMLVTDADGARRGGLRLYNDASEIVATGEAAIDIDPDRIPDLVLADLTGDGQDELLFFATASSPDTTVLVYRFTRRIADHRVLGLNVCSERMNGPDVTSLQMALLRRGFQVGPRGVDGWYGPDTRAAVVRFQRASGLPVTGVVDAAVWAALGVAAPPGARR